MFASKIPFVQVPVTLKRVKPSRGLCRRMLAPSTSMGTSATRILVKRRLRNSGDAFDSGDSEFVQDMPLFKIANLRNPPVVPVTSRSVAGDIFDECAAPGAAFDVDGEVRVR